MAALKDIIAYILKVYPHKFELSNARVTKMIYLADWRHAITSSCQVSPISWYFNNYGPFVWDVKDTALANPELFDVQETTNAYGDSKILLSLKDDDYILQLSEEERKSIDHVIEKTKALNWNSFIRLVYSTYPIASSERYTHLNLEEKASEYLMASKRLFDFAQ